MDDRVAKKKRVLMVCLGNSCRSPIAEAVFRDEIAKKGLSNGWDADSAALLEYHVGNEPEPRAVATLKKYGITSYSHIARQITLEDFYTFDWIFGMDQGIVNYLYQRRPTDCTAQILLLGEYDPNGERNIRDPLFDYGSTGFEKAYHQSVRSINAFLNHIQKTYKK